MQTISSGAFAVAAAGAVVAAVVDIRTRRIPNALTAMLAGAGLGLAATGISGVSIPGSMLGLLLGLALMMPGHLLGATGAGDVKLMAALGALVGPTAVLDTFLFTVLAGGVLAVTIALQRRRLTATLAGTRRLITRAPRARQQIRTATAVNRFAYGPAIAAGSVAALLFR